MAEILTDENPRKDLYRMLLADKTPGVADKIKKYSFNQFEKHLLSNEDAQNELGWYLEKKGVVSDPADFSQRYIQEPIAPPTPKPQPVPVAPSPVAIEEEEEAYIPEPPPAIGSSEYDAQLQAQYGGMRPTLGATFGGVPAAFETKAQKKQEQISPAFKAQKLAFEDVPIAEEQRRAQRQFAKATKERQQAALMGGPGFEVEQEKKAKERGYVEGAIDQIGAFAEGGKRIAKGILSTAGYYAQMQAATDPMASLPYGKRQEMMQQAGQTMYDNATAAQNTFQNEIAKRNIQTSVLQAIEKGQYNRIPEAVLYTIGDAAMQIIPSILTFGGSTYMQTLPQAYKDGVEAIAKEKGISPEQVIASGDDGMIVSQLNSGTQSMLEFAGAGLVSKGIASKGGYKAMRDWLLSQNVNRRLAQGAALLGVGTGEAATEYGQELTGQIGKTAAASSTTKAFLDKLPKELFTPEAKKQRQEAFVGGMVGGLGLAGGGQAIQSAMDRTLFEAPKIGKATQRPDMDIVQTDNKIQQRNRAIQAMEEAIKANPEAEGQIRQQYQKRINEAAPKDEEVLSAYESLSALPETEEKNTIRENLEAYMAEKGIAPQAEAVTAEEIQGTGKRIFADSLEEVPAEYRDRVMEVTTGPLARFGVGKKQYSYVIPTETIDITAPEAVTEEDIAEEIPFEEVPSEEVVVPPQEEDEDLAAFGRELEAIEQAAPVAPAEEELNIVEPDSELSQKILDNGEQVVSRLDAEKRIGDGERLFGFNEQDDSLVELSLQNLGAFPVDTIIAVRPEVIEEAPAPVTEEVPAPAPQAAPEEVVSAAPVEEVAPEAPAAPAPKGKVEVVFPTTFEATEVKPYAEVEDNYYRPDQQLKFNQGTYEPVRIIAHPDVIRAMSIGSKLRDNNKRKTVTEQEIDFANGVAKQLGFTTESGKGNAIMLHNAARELAKQNRSNTEERFVVIGQEQGGKKKAPAPKAETKQAAPVTPAPAAPKKEEAPKPEPTAKKIDKKSVQASLDKAKEEYEKAKSAFDKKRSELDKTTREDVKNLFGERKVEMKAKGLFEMPRISPEQRERAIQPFRDRMNKAKEEVNRLTKMLEEGEEAAKELTFEKEKEYEKVQGTGKKAREGKGAPKTERAVRPKAKPVRNAGKTPDAIAARNITFYSDPIATSLQYLMDATYHPDLLESIFGGPSRTTKSGRKDISGERKARIQFLDKTSNIKSADRLGEYLAERYAEENNIDVKDAEEQHDFASIATDIISSYSSRNQMVRELLRLNEQQNDEFEFMYNPEAIYGEGYNEDIAKEIDNILDELPDSYWEEREITDEEYGNLFAEEVEPETKEGKKAEAKKEKGRTPEEPTKKGVRFEKGKKLTEEEKKEVYKNLKDSYKEMKRPYTIETRVSQYTGRDYEARVWLENASDYMQTSDVTGRKLRYYIFLPDGTLAHPTEIFPNISPSEMTRVQRNVEYNERQANEKMDDITSQLKKSGEINKVVKAIETALNNGAEFVKEYDSGDVGQKNPLVMLRFPNGRKWGVPQYVINTQDSILGFTQKDVVKYNLGESREKIFDTNYQPDWEQFYNNNKQAKAQPSAPSFTSQQSSEAATAFDKAKTSNGFDKKYGKGAYKTLSDITKNFDEIMDKVSDKIKQDCL